MIFLCFPNILTEYCIFFTYIFYTNIYSFSQTHVPSATVQPDGLRPTASLQRLCRYGARRSASLEVPER